jgi:BASS family bile acid:Na+ symporter
MSRLLAAAADWFPAWVLAAAVLALWHPPLFTWFSGPWIVWGLAAVMLGMGLTLDVGDFAAVTRMPRAVAVGFVAQYTIMPLLAWTVARLLALPADFAVGLILVGCCPGGTASNVVTYLARADVALSVVMTTCSTLAAVVLTPLLTEKLAGAYVPVDALGMFLTTAQVVLAPVLIGLALHHRAPRLAARVLPAGPLLSVVLVSMIVGSIVAQNAADIVAHGRQLLLAVFLLHAGGFALGHAVTRALGHDRTTARTIAIEVGMQNSGLGAVLARTHFPAHPLTAVPAALSSVCHSVLGSLLAGWWRLRPDAPPTRPGRDP